MSSTVQLSFSGQSVLSAIFEANGAKLAFFSAFAEGDFLTQSEPRRQF